MIVFFKLARFFNELVRQFDKRRLDIDFLRLFGELHALLGLITIFLRSGHARLPTVWRPDMLETGHMPFRSNKRLGGTAGSQSSKSSMLA
jgi:hypothetical protein